MHDSLFRSPDRTSDRPAAKGEKLRIAVVPAACGAGASFVSSQILQKGPLGRKKTPEGQRTLVELGSPYFYTALGMDKRFKGRFFFDFSSHEKYKENIEIGYNWYLKIPGREDPGPSALFRAVSSAPGAMVVFDCSGMKDSPFLFQLLAEMDMIYLVVDPLPTKLIFAGGFIKKIMEEFPLCELVVNKYNKGIHRGELKKFLGTANYHVFSEVSYESFCRAEYNCNLVSSD